MNNIVNLNEKSNDLLKFLNNQTGVGYKAKDDLLAALWQQGVLPSRSIIPEDPKIQPGVEPTKEEIYQRNKNNLLRTVTDYKVRYIS